MDEAVDMRLVVDGRWTGIDGIARYSTEILPRLPIHTTLRSDNIRPASPMDPIWLGRAVRASGAQCFFSPGYGAALGTNIPQILVLHDLIHLEVKEESNRLKQTYYNRIVLPAVRRARRVITVSRFSAARIADWSGLALDRIVVAPGALSAAFTTVVDPPGRRERPYLIMVGNSKPHKNVGAALDAIRFLPDFDLVWVGGPSEYAQQPASSQVRPVTDIPDTDLASLYRGAQCLILPSYYEGFGLPAIEAMSQGVPVVYIADAVAEVVGDLGVRVKPNDPPATVAAAIRAAVALRGDRFLALARNRADDFSWDRSAADITAVLVEASDQPRGNAKATT